MQTMTLEQAAAFLGIHPVTLQQRAKAGMVPGAKVGKEWRFLDVDLVAYLRAQYPSSQLQPHPQCHAVFIAGKAARRGTSFCTTTDSEFEKALGLPIANRPSSITTSFAQGSTAGKSAGRRGKRRA